MVRIAIINESYPAYNLATDKMSNFFSQGHEVLFSSRADLWSARCDRAYISVIFTWDLPNAVQDIKNLVDAGVEVEVGGPAATALPQYIESQTGVLPHVGLDGRFEHVHGNEYRAVFTSRGCPRACGFCIVQQMEGREMIEYEDYPVPVGSNPYVCDNNILLTSWEHQVRMVERLKDVRNLDLNSGFDDRIFIRDPERYYNLYRNLRLEAWRFAYDKVEQREPIKECAEFLHGKGIDYRRIIVFCLVGYDTTMAESQERLQYLVDIGVSPYPMRYRPLDSVVRNYTPPGWKYGDMEMLFGYYGVPFVWRTIKWEEYSKDFKQRKAEGGLFSKIEGEEMKAEI